MVLLGLAVVVLLVGRAVRAQVNVNVGGLRQGRDGADSSSLQMPTGVARSLTERGIVNAAQLASMSPAEREFFVAVGGGMKV